MRHLHFIAAIDGAGDALGFIDAQDLPRSVEPWPKMAKYFRTPCFSRPSTSASESDTSTIASIAPALSASASPPAAAMARARAATDMRASATLRSTWPMILVAMRNHGLCTLRFVGERLSIAKRPRNSLHAQQQTDGCRKHDDRGLVREGRVVAVGNRQRPAETHLHAVAEDEGQQQRRHVEVELAQDVAGRPGRDHDPDVEGARP